MADPITLEQVEKIEEKKKTKKEAQEKPNLYNIYIALLKELGYHFVFNELSGREEILIKEKDLPVPMNDRIFDQIYIEFMKRSIKISASDLSKIIRGGVSTPYHPVIQYFDNLPAWDGQDHISKLAKTVEVEECGMDMNTLWPHFLKKWLVAAAAQATIEDATNHTCLVLMGGQGKGKTTWLNALCPGDLQHLRFTGHIRTNDKDSLNLLAEKFLVNIDDQLDLIKDLRYLKSMFTLDKVTNRKAFDKYNPNRPRICSFVASVNSSEFLTDDQNRRYLVFSVKDIDFKASEKLDREQIWAQVKYLLSNGFRYWFDMEENEHISTINDAFRVKPEEEEMLMNFFEPDEKGKPMMQTEILQYLQARSTSRLNSRILSTSLKKRDFPRKGVRMKVGNKETTRYVYLVRELSDHDRVVQEHKIVAELAADDALNK